MSKERLVDLHVEAVAAWDTYLDMCEEQDVEPEKTFDEFVADHLLANGVNVPPCKVGDKLYLLEDWGYKKELKEIEVGVILIKGTNDFSKELFEDFYGAVVGTFADIGKTVFLTKEEAEAKLKEKEEYAPFIGSKEDREGH